jgi:hypothetical protein
VLNEWRSSIGDGAQNVLSKWFEKNNLQSASDKAHVAKHALQDIRFLYKDFRAKKVSLLLLYIGLK